MSDSDPKIITQNPKMLEIIDLVDTIAKLSSSILLVGESGTGKDLIAHYIHCTGNRRENNMIKVDCNAIPATLFENELFGSEKGSFTGSYQKKTGKFELADKGIVYLDQIGDIPLHLQSKLTRVIEDRSFERIGGSERIQIDIQLISSTKIDLNHLVTAGKFREDLYYRLNVVTIKLPPLRNRTDDIPLLCEYFAQKYCQKYHEEKLIFEKSAINLMQSYFWPGNIRELENTIERLAISHPKKRSIQPDSLQLDFTDTSNNFVEQAVEGLWDLDTLENSYIQRILLKTKGNKSKAAKILGINRKTLLEKRRRYHLP